MTYKHNSWRIAVGCAFLFGIMETDKSIIKRSKKNKSSVPQRFLLDWYVVYYRSVIKWKEKSMKKLLFWFKRIIKGNNVYCDKCCLKCPYFKRCSRDGFEK